jgi:hypothetical protein
MEGPIWGECGIVDQSFRVTTGIPHATRDGLTGLVATGSTGPLPMPESRGSRQGWSSQASASAPLEGAIGSRKKRTTPESRGGAQAGRTMGADPATDSGPTYGRHIGQATCWSSSEPMPMFTNFWTRLPV